MDSVVVVSHHCHQSCHLTPCTPTGCCCQPLQGDVFSLGRTLLELALPSYFARCSPRAALARGLDPTLFACCQSMGSPGRFCHLPQSAEKLLGPELVQALNMMLHFDPALRATAWEVVTLPLFHQTRAAMGQRQYREYARRRRLLSPAADSNEVEVPDDHCADLETMIMLEFDPPCLLANPEGGGLYMQRQLQITRHLWGVAQGAAQAAAQQAQEVRGRRRQSRSVAWLAVAAS